MGDRPARIYREKPNQPYTRQSERKANDNYVKGAPAPRITQYEQGVKSGDFDRKIGLMVDEGCSIRSEALESARIAANSYLSKNLNIEEDYHLKILPYPHHVIRHHPLAGVAGADRYYEGMRKPFGKPVGRAAIVDENQTILFVRTDEMNTEDAKKALDRAGKKLPVSYRVKYLD